MALFIAESIRRKEFGSVIPEQDREALLDGIRPELLATLAAKGLPPGTRLLKRYATTRRGPRRIVYLVQVEAGDFFVLFYRDKNDAIGENITIKNPVFARTLDRYLDLLHADVAADRIEEIKGGEG